ncbi:NmrA family NAD(P)-binding protein [Phenylobacterium sp.]|uniref:NmrA family NAD(P)-binding protein n=1 Tax=Phenylobacterium sp. TaxID=1871053 RepID=UPI002E31A8F1|nr:NmrA family NAD(P)-binding protein [Phenylobacterium sp.]HEX3363778.1 NmrA family NAD(P)-binding protein [Phenylobacterium sp.]
MNVVMGVTGKVGGAVARTLLAADKPVRAVVRDAAKGAPWAERGCEVAVADLDDADRMAAAFAGAEAAFVMLPPMFDPSPGFPEARAMIAKLRQALDGSRLRRVVALSTVGADCERPNLLNQLGLLERALEDLPMPVAFLRAAWFMENAAWDVAAARDLGTIQSYLQPLDHPVPMISASDVGRVAAELMGETWTGHRVVELEAERVTSNAIAQALAEALGRPVRVEAIPRERWEAIFRAEGMQNPLPRIQMVDGFNQGWIDFPDRGASARRGAISLKQAIAEMVVAASVDA